MGADNGGALYTALLETDSWRGGDRREAPFDWSVFRGQFSAAEPPLQPCAVTGVTQSVVAAAMVAADPEHEKLVWDIRTTAEQITYIPQGRDDLLIVIATARYPVDNPQIPEWVLHALEEPESATPTSQTQGGTP
ncbi:hypothetical protein IFJ82_06875 [Novacetimonas hansenii]|uniref:hypothetical protein n=1 Tax=Novacetimonas hansenii TaxID=436 RepID=UPI00177F84B8|nr:hypothetical protein [Novacetimonas hansenii]QOF96280.1 hypothetical protein IFJ82_06875 [Novacetimonas hansenii]